jgi:hypothetical protein
MKKILLATAVCLLVSCSRNSSPPQTPVPQPSEPAGSAFLENWVGITGKMEFFYTLNIFAPQFMADINTDGKFTYVMPSAKSSAAPLEDVLSYVHVAYLPNCIQYTPADAKATVVLFKARPQGQRSGSVRIATTAQSNIYPNTYSTLVYFDKPATFSSTCTDMAATAPEGWSWLNVTSESADRKVVTVMPSLSQEMKWFHLP